jgi:hypothetical protein
LTGPDTVAHYEQVLRSATFASSVERPLGSEVIVTFVVNDRFYDSAPAQTTITYALPVPPSVVGRHIFYNESAFDGNNADIQPVAAGAYNDDSDAIDPTKSAYLLGSGPATFANISSYDKGINGIIIDLAAGGDHDLITADDFVFKVGNNNSPGLWADAPAPTAVSVIPAGGQDLSDRIVITWATGAIRNTWLEVQVLANEHTGLDAPDVFYWGNAVGGSGLGDTAVGAPTNATDQLAARNNPHGPGNLAPVQYPYDYNKDRSVNASDELIARNNGTGFLTQLIKINLNATASLAALVGDTGIASALASVLTATPRNATPEIGAVLPFSATSASVERPEPLGLLMAARAVDRAVTRYEPEPSWLNGADELVADLAAELSSERIRTRATHAVD